MDAQQEALAWQTGVWDRISEIYEREIDVRFAPVVEGCIARAGLRPGETVLDLGTGTGAAAARAAAAVGPTGSVTAVDLSSEMLELARRRMEAEGVGVDVREGRAEEIPAPDGTFDVIVASLSLMYAVDRQRAALECARVLRRGGRLVAAVWAGPEDADIVRFQQTAGMFAPPPPVAGVGPGALADPESFLAQLREAGIAGRVECEVLEFHFDDFEQAWDVLAGVTTANLDADRRAEAKQAVQQAMWPDPTLGRRFANRTQFIVGRKE
ncbi:MAG TPA: methyltransferase domain-containing protein [Acidimicrobiales bacterium]|nr:methyltransferase domain-containing protein [Acidimicrobiales bacterium]